MSGDGPLPRGHNCHNIGCSPRELGCNRIAVATIAPSSTDVQLEFAATDIPLTVTSRDFATPEQALEWVRDKGLIVDGA